MRRLSAGTIVLSVLILSASTVLAREDPEIYSREFVYPVVKHWEPVTLSPYCLGDARTSTSEDGWQPTSISELHAWTSARNGCELPHMPRPQ